MDIPASIIGGILTIASLILLILSCVKYHKAKKILSSISETSDDDIDVVTISTSNLIQYYNQAVEKGNADTIATITSNMHDRCRHSQDCKKSENICPLCRRYEH